MPAGSRSHTKYRRERAGRYIASHQKTLNYKPGDEWSYTNTGYNLLAILVQRVSGKSLAEFTHDNIFSPLGMQATSWRDDFQRIVPNRAIAYEQANGSEHQLMPFENAYGNGGLLTTVDDLLRWNDRFSAPKIGDSSFVKSELEPGRLNDGRALFYAAGLFLTEHDGAREISHSGATAGYRAWLGFYPDRQLSVAVLCNSAEAHPVTLAHKVVDVYLLPRAINPPDPLTLLSPPAWKASTRIVATTAPSRSIEKTASSSPTASFRSFPFQPQPSSSRPRAIYSKSQRMQPVNRLPCAS